MISRTPEKLVIDSELSEIQKVEDFLKLKSLGKGSINKEKVFLLEVLEFIKKFKETKNEV